MYDPPQLAQDLRKLKAEIMAQNREAILSDHKFSSGTNSSNFCPKEVSREYLTGELLSI